MRSSVITGSLVAFAALLSAGGAASGAPPERLPAQAPAPPAYVPGELLVRFRPGTAASARAAVNSGMRASVLRTLPVPGAQLVKLPAGQTVAAAVQAYQKNPNVLYAEPNSISYLAATPNDPAFDPNQWGLYNHGQTVQGTTGTAGADINARAAWDTTTGSSAVKVGIVDSGIDYGHPDLAANIDTADSHNFPANSSDASDDQGHGTFVAGVIGAVGNNGAGVAGVNWNVSLVALKACLFDPNSTQTPPETCTAADQAAAYTYAATHGIKVVNSSLSGQTFSQTVYDAITNAPGTLFVFAAGNQATSNDSKPRYPCNYTAPNTICVAASDQNDKLAAFSDYGPNTVDLAAPGVNIYSTWLRSDPNFGDYRWWKGTSFSCAYVSGAAGLIWSQFPGATVAQVKSAILGGVDPLASLAGKVATGGRLDINTALALMAPDNQVPTKPTNLTAAATGSTSIHLAWTASMDNVGVKGYHVYRNGNSTPIATLGKVTSFDDTGLSPSTPYSYTVDAFDAAGNISPMSDPAQATTQAASALLFSDGFESGGWSLWTSQTGLTLVHSPVFAGSWSANATSAGSGKHFASKTLSSTAGTLYYDLRFFVASRGANLVELMRFKTAAGGSLVSAALNSSGKLITKNLAHAATHTSSTVVTSGVWHELQVRVAVGSSGHIDVWLDGSPVTALSTTDNLNTTAIGRITFGDPSGHTYNVTYDQIGVGTSPIGP